MDTAAKTAYLKSLFDDYLNTFIGKLEKSGGLHSACAYSLSAPGKRLRPIVAMLSCEACSGDPIEALPVCMAIEMIHTFSLIHDDLPAIDNDDLRRGRPTCHKAFGEATAILAGDALVFMAISSIGESGLKAGTKTDILTEIADACGLNGLIKGEYDDIMSEGKPPTFDEIIDIYIRKTSRLFELAAYSGARIASAPKATLNSMRMFGKHLGLAFQAIDDILDVTSESGILGKTAGKDIIQDKATIVKAIGVEGSRKWAAQQTGLAIKSISGLNARHLNDIATGMLKRLN